jgi:alpha-D-ribose 1-methylphosphonate 5-triphosphate diphosphatase
MASHDDDDAEQIAAWVATGVGIAEFPINLRAARAATAAGMTTLFGAPNILRGRSSGGNISAIEAVLAGACGGLCADYHPPALLAAALHLPGISPLSLPDAVRLVAQAPAEAAGLADRGAIVPGRRADLLLVAPGPVPQVEAVLVGGRLALDTQDRSIPACV